MELRKVKPLVEGFVDGFFCASYCTVSRETKAPDRLSKFMQPYARRDPSQDKEAFRHDFGVAFRKLELYAESQKQSRQ